MAVIPPWTAPLDFIGAARAGAQIGLSRQQMEQEAEERSAALALQRDELAARMSEASAARAQAKQRQDAAIALQQERLKQLGLLGQERIDNQEKDVAARTALDQSRIETEKNKPIFSNTGGGLMQYDPVLKKWNVVEGSKTSRPPSAVAPKQEIRQVLNPAHVVGGVVDTNTPAYLSLTNTTRALPLFAPTTNPSPSTNAPSQVHIDYLLAHPETASQFDERFGDGASAQYLKETNLPPAYVGDTP